MAATGQTGRWLWRFVKVEREIDTDSYQPSIGVHLVFAGAIVVAAVAMVLYLLLAGPT